MKALVVATKLKNTATVLVERRVVHPLYKKSFIRTKKYQVNDTIGVKDGDVVEILKIKPISKKKHWGIVKVLGKNLIEITEGHLKEQAKKTVAEVIPEKKARVVPAISPQAIEVDTGKKQRKTRKRKESLIAES
jgi:small subunit ribosomal protein S17